MELKKVEFQEARRLLAEGDVLLFRGKGFWSYFIKKAAYGRYSHVGLASSHGTNGDRIWECIEFREYKGGRSVNLGTYLKLYKGEIDVYRPSSIKRVYRLDTERNEIMPITIGLNTKAVTNVMRKMTGLPYGWKRILFLAQLKIPFLRLFYSIESMSDDSIKDPVYPICSTAVAYSFAKSGFDLVHNRSDSSTEPSDIARSPLLSYIFTIEPPKS